MNVSNKLLTAFFMLFLGGFLINNCKEKKEDITPLLLAVYNQHPYHSAYTTKTAANNYSVILFGFDMPAAANNAESLANWLSGAKIKKTIYDRHGACSAESAYTQTIIDSLTNNTLPAGYSYPADYTAVKKTAIVNAVTEGTPTLTLQKYNVLQIQKAAILGKNDYDEFSASLLVSSGCSTALRNANINIENAWITLTTPPANLKINPVFSGISCVYGSASAVSTIAGKCATLADAF